MYMLNTSATVPTSTSTLSTTTTGSLTSLTGTSTPATLSPTGPITVTNLIGWTYIGCYTEATNTRALNGLENPIATDATDVESCAAACSQYTYFGVEYGQECYCGDVINAGSIPENSTIPTANGCDMACNANPNEYCGGRVRLNMYQYSPIVSSSSSSSISGLSSTGQSSSLGSLTISTQTSSVLQTSTQYSSSSQSSTFRSSTLQPFTSQLSSSQSFSSQTSSVETSSSQSSSFLSSTPQSSSSSLSSSSCESSAAPSPTLALVTYRHLF
jgi:hypothetical protein